MQVTNSTKYAKTTAWVTAEDGGLLTSKSHLELTTHAAYFPGGRMTVRCESNQFLLYKKYSVIELMDDSPRLAQMISPTTVLRSGKWYTLNLPSTTTKPAGWNSVTSVVSIITSFLIKSIYDYAKFDLLYRQR